MELGLTPIRLNPTGRAEVVWTIRLDPARGRIVNIPFPASGRRYGDVVLHDGSSTGQRMLDGQEVPVFDELALLVEGPYSTFHAVVSTALNDDLLDLSDLAEQHDVVVQNWTANTRTISREESERLPKATPPAERTGTVALGIAARTEAAVRTFLAAWTRAAPFREVPDVHLGLNGTLAQA